MLEEQEGRLVCPVEVVEAEDEASGRGSGDAAQEVGDALEENVALSALVGTVANWQIEEAAQLGNNPTDLRSCSAQLGFQVVDRGGADVVLKGLDKGQVGRHTLGVVGVAKEDSPAFGGGLLSGLPQEPGLADTGLAGDEQDAALTPRGRCEPLADRRKLALAANKRCPLRDREQTPPGRPC